MNLRKKKKKNELAVRKNPGKLVIKEDVDKAHKNTKKKIKEAYDVARAKDLVEKKRLEDKVKINRLREYIDKEGEEKAKEALELMQKSRINFRHATAKLEGIKEVEEKIVKKYGIKGSLAGEIAAKSISRYGEITKKGVKEEIKKMVQEGVLNKKFLKKNRHQ